MIGNGIIGHDAFLRVLPLIKSSGKLGWVVDNRVKRPFAIDLPLEYHNQN
jgi:hypothetical protein